MKEWIPGELQFNYYLHYLLLLQGFPQFLIDYAFVISVPLCIYYLLAFVLYVPRLTQWSNFQNLIQKLKTWIPKHYQCSSIISFMYWQIFGPSINNVGHWEGERDENCSKLLWRIVIKTGCRNGEGGCQNSEKLPTSFMDGPFYQKHLSWAK